MIGSGWGWAGRAWLVRGLTPAVCVFPPSEPKNLKAVCEWGQFRFADWHTCPIGSLLANSVAVTGIQFALVAYGRMETKIKLYWDSMLGGNTETAQICLPFFYGSRCEALQ